LKVELTIRRVETRSGSWAFIAVFKALLISSRNIAMPFADSAAVGSCESRP
jgi:hypothetical protein